jgi:predicted nucleic acid-binding protein
MRLSKAMSTRRSAQLRDDADRNLARIALVPLDQSVLKRAGEPLPSPLKTLDAIHLATAEFLNCVTGDIVLLAHDRQLGVAALSWGWQSTPIPMLHSRSVTIKKHR